MARANIQIHSVKVLNTNQTLIKSNYLWQYAEERTRGKLTMQTLTHQLEHIYG